MEQGAGQIVVIATVMDSAEFKTKNLESRQEQEDPKEEEAEREEEMLNETETEETEEEITDEERGGPYSLWTERPTERDGEEDSEWAA